MLEKGINNNLNFNYWKTTTDQENTIQGSSLLFENRYEREWLTTKEAAHILAVTENALRILVHKGQVPAYKFGHRLRFRLGDCLALFKRKGV